ncbi:hypothetical protein D3C73_1583190 [compost metagenome]
MLGIIRQLHFQILRKSIERRFLRSDLIVVENLFGASNDFIAHGNHCFVITLSDRADALMAAANTQG